MTSACDSRQVGLGREGFRPVYMRPSLRRAAEVNRELERRLVEQTEGSRWRGSPQSGDGPTMVEDLDLTATAHHPQVPRQVSFNSDTDAASM